MTALDNRGASVRRVRPRRLASLASLCAAAIFWLAPNSVAAETRAVLELFTSQGCSSCPPADKLIGELAADPSLVVMSLPIDYWDYLGWRDTLARPRHSARQRGYAAVRGDRKVYTPQVVVNGLVHVVGSDRNAIEEAVARTKGEPSVLSVGVAISASPEELMVTIKPKNEQEAVADVWLVVMARHISVAIQRGENKGKSVVYTNVARRWVNLGLWTGGEQHWKVQREEYLTPDSDLVAVLVQAGGSESPATVLGAHAVPLR